MVPVNPLQGALEEITWTITERGLDIHNYGLKKVLVPGVGVERDPRSWGGLVWLGSQMLAQDTRVRYA